MRCNLDAYFISSFVHVLSCSSAELHNEEIRCGERKQRRETSETPMLFQLVRPGHTKAANTVSIMSSEKPDWYLRHANYRVSLTPAANTDLWLKDATFIEHPDTFFDGFTAFQSVNYPEYYISVNDRQELYIRRFEDTALFHESASFVAGKVLSTHDHLGLREHYIFVMNIYI